VFREMRRQIQLLSSEETIRILNRGTSGVLAVAGDDDYPYAVPLSYVYHDHKLYFHCAGTGHKLDAIARNEKVSLCVIDKDQVVPAEYTTYFRSAIVFGKARILEDEAARRNALEILAAKYCPDLEEGQRLQVIAKDIHRTCIVELTVDHMTGKEAIELVKATRSPTD